MDRDSFKILDDLTLRVTMRTPFSIFDQAVADDINLGIVPLGYDPKRPVGTGAFKFDSFTPGQQSEFVRYEGFWGQPAHVDRLTLIDSFGSDTAAYNALQGGDIDMFAAAPLALARLVRQAAPQAQCLGRRTNGRRSPCALTSRRSTIPTCAWHSGCSSIGSRSIASR